MGVVVPFLPYALAIGIALIPPGAGECSQSYSGGLMFTPNIQTVNSTPVVFTGGSSFPEDSVGCCPVRLFAQDHNGNAAFWSWQALFRRTGSATPVIGPGTPDIVKTAGATLWAASLLIQDGVLSVQVTGILAGTIDWFAFFDDPEIVVGAFSS